jgi:hypothetical protein
MCEVRKTASGDTVIVCTRGSRKPGGMPKCARCGLPAAHRCDAPADPGAPPTYRDEEGKGRCSIPLCSLHTYRAAGDDKDYCFAHRPAGAKPVRSEKVEFPR